jgi:carboxyl-terminal processing protease
MNNPFVRFPKVFLPIFILLSLSLAACAGLPLPGISFAGDEPANLEFGPSYTPQERQVRTLEAIWTLMEQNYVYYEDADVDWIALKERYSQRVQTELNAEEFEALIHELESELPADSLTWQSRADRIEADLLASESYQGIGAIVDFEEQEVPHVVILSVVSGSPAEKAGLQAHDSILSIDGEPVRPEEGLSVVERIRGPAGSDVTLEVQTPGQSKRSITVTRGELVSTGKLEASQISLANSYFGYLLFPPISYEGLVDDLMKVIQVLTANRHLDGLILDLRVAGSSRGWPLEELLTVFHDGPIGEFYNRAESQRVAITGQDILSSQTVPLAVLVGQNTTGFPEIMAAALQDSERAVIIGAPTSGSIETAASFYLPDGSHAFVESASFRLPGGEELGQNGIKPDVLVEAGWDEVVPDQDPVLDAALEALGSDQ